MAWRLRRTERRAASASRRARGFSATAWHVDDANCRPGLWNETTRAAGGPLAPGLLGEGHLQPLPSPANADALYDSRGGDSVTPAAASATAGDSAPPPPVCDPRLALSVYLAGRLPGPALFDSTLADERVEVTSSGTRWVKHACAHELPPVARLAMLCRCLGTDVEAEDAPEIVERALVRCDKLLVRACRRVLSLVSADRGSHALTGGAHLLNVYNPPLPLSWARAGRSLNPIALWKLVRGAGPGWQYVVASSLFGADLSVREEARPVAPGANYPSCLQRPEAFRQLCEEELDASRFVVVSPALAVRRPAPLAVIPKSTPGRFRLIEDLTDHGLGINDCTVTTLLPTPTTSTVADFADALAQLRTARPRAVVRGWTADVANCFRRFATRPADWLLVSVVLPTGERATDRALAMGGRASSSIVNLTVQLACRALSTPTLRLTSYCDDILAFTVQGSAVARAEQAHVLQKLAKTGLRCEDHKVTQIDIDVSFVGYRFRLGLPSDWTVSLSDEGLAHLREDLNAALALTEVPTARLSTMLGRLARAGSLCPLLKAAARPIRRCLLRLTSDGGCVPAVAQLDQSALSGVRMALATLRDAQWPRPLRLLTSAPPPVSAWVATDACETGGGIVAVIQRDRFRARSTRRFAWFVRWDEWIPESVRSESLVAALALLVVSRQLPSGGRIHLVSDSTATVAAARFRARSAAEFADPFLPLAGRLVMRKDLLITSAHIPGVRNVACDWLSRSQALHPSQPDWALERAWTTWKTSCSFAGLSWLDDAIVSIPRVRPLAMPAHLLRAWQRSTPSTTSATPAPTSHQL